MKNTLLAHFPLLDARLDLKGTYLEKDVLELEKDQTYVLNSLKSKIQGDLKFLSALHDSEVISVNEKEGSLIISLKEFSSLCLYDAIFKYYRLKGKKNTSHLDLFFSNVKNLKLSYVNRNTKLIPTNKKKNFPRLQYYLFDQFKVLENESINCGILFWNSHSQKKQYSLLSFNCEKIEINEFIREAFLNDFNGNFINIFDSIYSETHLRAQIDYNFAYQFISGFE